MELPPITSSQNRLISRVRRLLAKPRECRREGVLIADGVHLVQEALRANLPCSALFVTQGQRAAEIDSLVQEAQARRLSAYPVLPHIFRSISPVETPQGIVGVFERPRTDRASLWREARATLNGSGPGHLAICDGLQDPTNLGSVARSAWAAGVRGLITTPGTVDPFHHRTLRAAMGALFHMPVLVEEPAAPLVTTLKNLGFRTIGLSPHGEVQVDQLDPAVPSALFLGAEGGGLAPALLSTLDTRARIPMARGVDSLGVAAAAAVAFVWLRLARRG